jgi:hypothetical protein
MMNIKKMFTQVHIPYVGAAWDLAGRVSFIFNCLNYLLMTRVYYFNTGDSLIRDTFKSYGLFLFTAFLLFAVLSVVLYVIVVPSHNKFVQDQSYIDGRSILYDSVCSVNDNVIELQKKIVELQSQIEDIKKQNK